MATGPGPTGKGHDFLRTIARFAEADATPSSSNKTVKLGRVDYDYNPADFLGGINPRILFDGESTTSQKRYPVMPPYYPLPGARVCLIPVGTTYLIIGAVENVPQDPDVQIFTSTDTWDKPAGARAIRVQCQAGGGGGGGAAATGASQCSAGTGAAGGSYGESLFSANAVPASVTVTVGAGGAMGNPGAGGSGGTSSFGSLVSASGGLGGGVITAGGTASTLIGANAFSPAITADLTFYAAGGGAAVRIGTQGASGGFGGSSYLGGGANASGITTGTNVGRDGGLYGGGGGGACAGPSNPAQAGGAGGAGVVIITTLF